MVPASKEQIMTHSTFRFFSIVAALAATATLTLASSALPAAKIQTASVTFPGIAA